MLVRVKAEVVRQIQGTARESVVYDQITNWLLECGVICVMSYLLHALPRHPSLPKPNGAFLVVCYICERETPDDVQI